MSVITNLHTNTTHVTLGGTGSTNIQFDVTNAFPEFQLYYDVVINTNVMLQAPTNAADNQTFVLSMLATNGSPYQLTFQTGVGGYHFPYNFNSNNYVLSTNGNPAVDVIAWRYMKSLNIWVPAGWTPDVR